MLTERTMLLLHKYLLATCHFNQQLYIKIFLRYYLLSIALIGLYSCSDFGQIRFDKSKWRTKDDMEFPFRDRMLKDLTKNHKLVGLKHSEILNLLGEPNIQDSSSFAYKLIEDYGWDIDPVYTKNLEFEFNPDSIITAFKIEEWKK